MTVGSEVFVPKLCVYNIRDVKDTLTDLLGHAKYQIVNMEPREKRCELSINEYEISHTKDLVKYASLDTQGFANTSVQTETTGRYKKTKKPNLSTSIHTMVFL